MSSSAEEATSCLLRIAENTSTALIVCSMLGMQRPSANHRAGTGMAPAFSLACLSSPLGVAFSALELCCADLNSFVLH